MVFPTTQRGLKLNPSIGDRVVRMLMERKIWMTLRRMEDEVRGKPTGIFLDDLTEAIGTTDLTKIERGINALKRDEHITSLEVYHDGNKGYTFKYMTNPASDKYFAMQYWWPKLVDEIGFLKVLVALSAITAIVTFVVGILLKD